MSTFSVVILTAAPSAGMDPGSAFVKVDGRECLLKSVELFLNRDPIKQIQLVVLPAALEESKRKFGPHFAFSGVKLLPGGPTWLDQLAAATEKVSPECSHVIIHDAARPIVAFNDIDALIDEAQKHVVVALATPMRSSLAKIDETGEILSIESPQRFMQVVTPWAIKREKFVDLAKAKREPSPSEVHLLKGSHLNMRVNSAGDAILAKAMIGMLPKPKMRAADNPFEEAQW